MNDRASVNLMALHSMIASSSRNGQMGMLRIQMSTTKHNT